MARMFPYRRDALKPISLACLGLILSSGNLHATEQLALNTVRRPAEVERQEVKPPADVVLVKGFAFTGNTSVGTAELDALLFSFVGQACGLDKLREAAGKVTEEYHRRGMSLARAYVPAQQIEGGIVAITVIEGRIGELTIEGNRNYSTNFIRRYLTADSPERQLTIEQLEKGLLLLNSNFTDLKATANFVPGKEPGTADLVVKVEDKAPLHLTLSSNNYGSEQVSRVRFNAQAEWIDALIPGSSMAVSTTIGEDVDNMKVISGSYTLPVNSIGTMIGFSVFDGNFDIGKDFAELGFHNEETSADFYISHPLLKRRQSSITGMAGYRTSDADYYRLDQISSEDRSRVAYVRLQADQALWGGRNFYDLTISQGLGTAFGGSGKAETIPTSRASASNEFTRVNLGLARYQPISNIFSSLIRLSGQLSGDNLMVGEEWLIGGVNSVHGYALGEASGDNGYLASLSLRATPLQKKERLVLAAYLDYGYAHKKYAQPGSDISTDLMGVGLGLTSHLDTFAGTDLRLDIGIPLSPSDNYLNEKPIIYFETAFRF